jgi:ribosome maturation factor RimP
MKEKVKSGLYKDIENKIGSILKNNNYELVDIDIIGGKNKHIIVYIYRFDKTGIDDLESISRLIYPFIENIKTFSDGFSLELSSPGIFRNIKYKEEFNIFNNKNAKIVLTDGIVKIGILKGLKDNFVDVLINNQLEKIDLNEIKSAKLNG